MLIGEILVALGKTDPARIEAALARQKSLPTPRRLGELLIEEGAIGEADLLQALGRQFDVGVLERIDADALDSLLVARLPVEWARSNVMLPIRADGVLAVATDDPTRMAAAADLALLLGEELETRLAPKTAILKAIEQCYFNKTDTTEEVLKDLRAETPMLESVSVGSDDLLRRADQAPVAQLVNVILLEAVKARASDIHIEPFEKNIVIRYRVDGLLYEQTAPPKRLEAALISRLKVMARLDIAEKRMPQDGAARVRVGEREIDVRVSTIPVAEGERMVLRLLDRDSALLPLSALGMPEDVLARFRSLLREPNGVALVTGPTGSGKTTTLYASLRELDTAHRNVLTIEDPIEYQLPHIGQMQVKPKIGLTFSQGLRHILRQDPDVILVGETRDLETAEIMVRASMTGHLVFSTLHTNDAAGAVVRLMDMGVPAYLLSSALRASLAQRLVRRLCPVCREASTVTEEEAASLGRWADRVRGRPVWRPRGCRECLGGYRGRIGLYELLTVTPELREAIRAGESVAEFRRLAAAAGMRDLMEDGIGKILSGETGIAEVLRAVGRADGGSGGRRSIIKGTTPPGVPCGA